MARKIKTISVSVKYSVYFVGGEVTSIIQRVILKPDSHWTDTRSLAIDKKEVTDLAVLGPTPQGVTSNPIYKKLIPP